MTSELGIANLEFTIGSLLACSVDRSFLVGFLNLDDLLVDSLVFVDRLLYLSHSLPIVSKTDNL